MKRLKWFSLFILVLFPCIVFAESGNYSLNYNDIAFPAIFTFLFYVIFIYNYLKKIFNKCKPINILLILIAIRVTVMIIGILYGNITFFVIDLLIAFFTAFILSIVSWAVSFNTSQKPSKKAEMDLNNMNKELNQMSVLRCLKCGKALKVGVETCPSCGTPVTNNPNVKSKDSIVEVDYIYLYDENTLLRKVLLDELSSQGESAASFITGALNKKKNILLTIFGILMFICVTLYYFNYPSLLCIWAGLLLWGIYYLINKKFDGVKELAKRVRTNPDEEISKIIKEMKTEKPVSLLNPKLKFLIAIIVSIVLPSLYFIHPRIIYTNYSDGYQVFRYSKSLIKSNEEVVIPSSYKGKQVLAIGKSAFKNSKIEAIKLPEGLETIKTKAFSNCKNLKSIEIPSSVLEIRGRAFEYDTNLSSVTLHDGIKEIRGSAFYANTSLSEIYLPETLEYLGASAFEGCESLISVTIPKGVTEINGATFKDCLSLREVNLHNGIISIHGETFSGDESLVHITLPPNITEIRGNTFENCTSLTSIVIPEGVTRIGGHAFYGCTSLSSVTIPSTVKEIGSSAFRQCYELRNVTVPEDAVINERAFKESPTYVERIYYGG